MTVPWLRTLITALKDTGLILCTHRAMTSSWGFSTLFWSLWVPETHVVHMHALGKHMYTQK